MENHIITTVQPVLGRKNKMCDCMCVYVVVFVSLYVRSRTYPVIKNGACFIAMEAGISKVITATYKLMKMICFSLQWKRE